MVCWVIRVGSCLKEKRLRPHLFECRCPQNNTHHVPKRCADEGSKNTVILDVCVTKFATTLVSSSKNDGAHSAPKHCADEGPKNTVILEVCVTKFATSLVLPSKNDGGHHTPKSLSENLSRLCRDRFAICRKSVAKSVANLSESVANLSQICRNPCCPKLY